MDSTNSHTVVVSDDAVIITREQAAYVVGALSAIEAPNPSAPHAKFAGELRDAINEQVTA